MGFIDPMTINSAAATGVIDFSGGSVIWLLLVGVLAGAFGGIVFASAQSWRPTRRGLPRLATPRLGAELAGRAR
jgi:hypothetical protein